MIIELKRYSPASSINFDVTISLGNLRPQFSTKLYYMIEESGIFDCPYLKTGVPGNVVYDLTVTDFNRKGGIIGSDNLIPDSLSALIRYLSRNRERLSDSAIVLKR